MTVDTHTHRPDAQNAVICAPLSGFLPREGKLYSLGVHPWESGGNTASAMCRLRAEAEHPQVVMIGETGLDRLRGASLRQQAELFAAHVHLSEQLHKPLLLHVVWSTDLLLAVRKAEKPGMPWIWHGFRGNRQTAEMLVGKGFYLSFGERWNADAVRSIPTERLLIETDDSQLSINQIAERIAAVRNAGTADVLAAASATLHRLTGQ